jgi:hypothetical protein
MQFPGCFQGFILGAVGFFGLLGRSAALIFSCALRLRLRAGLRRKESLSL